ncbi:MAG: glycosyltransferase [Eubacteriales bacterium]|nr:glycosyltransferase [Eubacteriales bacterium]
MSFKAAYKGQQIRKELGIPLNAKVVLSVGEVNKNKNHKVGIEALSKLNDKGVYYVICGRGPLMEAHKELAKELGVGDRVIFKGYRTDVADFYKMADVFLFPSFREGLPVAVIEAMVSGLPVIATKIRGSSDLVENAEVGALVAPDDISRLTRELTNKLNVSRMKVMRADMEKVSTFRLNTVLEQVRAIYLETT